MQRMTTMRGGGGGGRLLLLLGVVVCSFSGVTFGSAVILNEYNGVASDRWLDCDDPPIDPDCTSTASDVFFGRVEGNGKDWFELVVVADHADIRGWDLSWEEDGGTTFGTLTLSDDALWSDLRSGTIITFAESRHGSWRTGYGRELRSIRSCGWRLVDPYQHAGG